jgi:hypothetical protein
MERGVFHELGTTKRPARGRGREVCSGVIATTLSGALLALLGACNSDLVAGVESAVSGGTVADSAEFDAVMCMPAPDAGAGCVESGWDMCIGRCENTLTLVTPNIVMGTRLRAEIQTLPFELGSTTLTRGVSGPPPDSLGSSPPTAVEIGSAINAVDDGPTILRHAVGCYELRKSGLAPCCLHPYFLDTSVPVPGGFAQRVYIPPVDLWEVDFDDPAHGVAVVGPYGTYAGPHTYDGYLRTCAEPMARDDDLVSAAVFFVLSERVPESAIQPIPLALRYPDGGTDPLWLETSTSRGDVAGFGAGAPGETSLESSEGIRRAALAATALVRRSSRRFMANGGAFDVASALTGDGLFGGRRNSPYGLRIAVDARYAAESARVCDEQRVPLVHGRRHRPVVHHAFDPADLFVARCLLRS